MRSGHARRYGRRGDETGHGRALRVSAEHLPGLGAARRHRLDVRTRVTNPVDDRHREIGAAEVGAGLVVDRVHGERPTADLPAQRVDERSADAADTGRLAVPRANTTSTSGHRRSADGAGAASPDHQPHSGGTHGRRDSAHPFRHHFKTPISPDRSCIVTRYSHTDTVKPHCPQPRFPIADAAKKRPAGLPASPANLLVWEVTS